MVRRILVPLYPSPYSDTALEYGCYIAKKNKGNVNGLAVLDNPGIQDSVGAVPMGGSFYAKKMREENEQEALTQIEKLLANFKKKCTQEGVAHREVEDQGSPAERIITFSRFYDLLITGLKTKFNFGETGDTDKTVLEFLDHSATPMLLVPESFKKPDPVKKVLIAFNGSVPSARALQSFTQVINPENVEVTLIISDDSTGDNMQESRYFIDQAAAYLQAHDFKNVTKEFTPESVIDVIDEKYYDQVDLIVAGMHSKKGLLDFFVGSLSRHLIEKAKTALLLA